MPHLVAYRSNRTESNRGQLFDVPNSSHEKNIGAKAAVGLGQALLVIVPIANVLWYPLLVVDVAGSSANIVPMDLVLICSLLLAVLLAVFQKTTMTQTERLAWKVVILANAPLILSPLPSLLATYDAGLVSGLLVHLKRIGLASILLPLAVQCGASRLTGKMIASVLASAGLLLMVGPALLGLDDTYVVDFMASTGRNVSLLYDPNTVGLVAGIYGLYLLAYLGRRTGKLINLTSIVGIGVLSIVFVAAASRTASVALVPVLFYVAIRRRAMLAVWLVMWVVVIGVFLSSENQSLQENLLISRFLGIEQMDSNFSERLRIQAQTLADWSNSPLGVGISNLGRDIFSSRKTMPTTDSLYIDYLAAMGPLGVASVIGVLVTVWRGLKGTTVTIVAAQCILLYTALFSFSVIGLASNFVSPLFFLFMGLGLSTSARQQKRIEGNCQAGTD